MKTVNLCHCTTCDLVHITNDPAASACLVAPNLLLTHLTDGGNCPECGDAGKIENL